MHVFLCASLKCECVLHDIHVFAALHLHTYTQRAVFISFPYSITELQKQPSSYCTNESNFQSIATLLPRNCRCFCTSFESSIIIIIIIVLPKLCNVFLGKEAAKNWERETNKWNWRNACGYITFNSHSHSHSMRIYHGRTFIRFVMCLWGYIMGINAWEYLYFLSL